MVSRDELPADTAGLQNLLREAERFLEAASTVVHLVQAYGFRQLSILQSLCDLASWRRAETTGDLEMLLQFSNQQGALCVSSLGMIATTPGASLSANIDLPALHRQKSYCDAHARSDACQQVLANCVKAMPQGPQTDDQVCELVRAHESSIYATGDLFSTYDRVVLQAVRELEQVARTSLSRRIPHWNDDRRQLTFGGKVCLALRREAENQQALLSEFESKGWPACIFSPLEMDTTVQTIKDLNNSLRDAQLHFGQKNKGKQATWRISS